MVRDLRLRHLKEKLDFDSCKKDKNLSVVREVRLTLVGEVRLTIVGEVGLTVVGEVRLTSIGDICKRDKTFDSCKRGKTHICKSCKTLIYLMYFSSSLWRQQEPNQKFLKWTKFPRDR